MPLPPKPRFTDRNLYGPNGPNVTDIKQDAFGDCYFVATLAAVARQNPTLIRDAISYNPRGHNFLVRLYTLAGKKKYLYITQAEIADNIVRRGGSTMDNTGKDERSWPAVMETAYAKLFDTDARNGLGQGYAAIINGGQPADAMMAITGSTGTQENYVYYPRLGDKGSRNVLGNRISVALAQNKAVTLTSYPDKDTRGFFAKLFNQTIPKNGLVDLHLYTVLSASVDTAGEWSFTLQNPWGNNNRVGEGRDSPSANITVTLKILVDTGGMGPFGISK